MVLIGERIKIARVMKKWNQAELAFRSGVATSFISHVETGRKRPSLETLKRIADALGVTQADLVEEDVYSDPKARKNELVLKVLDDRNLFDIVVLLQKIPKEKRNTVKDFITATPNMIGGSSD